MEWDKNLRIGTSVRNIRRLQYQIAHRQVHPTVFLIACDRQENGRLEILPSTVLLQADYPHKSLYIAGVAGYRKEALEITASIIEDTYRNNHDFDAFRYLTERENGSC